MNLTPTEQQRLLVFTAAELARRTRDQGLRLNAPEATALIVDTMQWAARAGRSYPQVVEAGMRAVQPGEVLDGVADLVREVRAEVLLDEGSRLVVLRDPLGAGPGAIVTEPGDIELSGGRPTVTLTVTNTSAHAVRVSSHLPFDQVNARLSFDRAAAAGYRLDLPAGELLRFAPGETRSVPLVGAEVPVGSPDAG